MALQYGLNITASDMAKILEENDKQQTGVRTWRQLFGNASLGYGAQSDALKTDYASAISQAYASNFAQKNAIMNAGLSAGSTNQMLAQNRNALHAAYQTAMSNYANAAGNLAQSYGSEVNQIQTDLSARAKNFADLYNRAYEYLVNELYGATYTEAGTSTNGATPIVEGEGKKAKITGYNSITHDYIKEHSLEWALNKDGSAIRSWDDLSHELFNEDGTLTMKGREFFDQMFNTGSDGYTRTDKDGNVSSMRGFDQWLSDTDSELRDWWASGDAYNYTKAGTNAGTAKTLVGLESTDNTYNKWEHQATNISTDTSEGLSRSGSQIVSSFDEKLKEYEDVAKNSNNVPTIERTYNDIAAELGDMGEKYAVEASTGINTIKNDFLRAVGRENADAFWAENASLLEEFNSALTQFSDTSKALSKSKLVLRKGFIDEFTSKEPRKENAGIKLSATKLQMAELQSEINSLYDRIIKAMNTYSKKIVSDGGKTSGF